MYDGHGSVTQELRSGKEVNSYYYDPYGAVERGTEENDIIFGYNGEEYTEATQLQYLRQRHYAPDLGSFLTQDMYRGDLYEPNSQNRYTYAGNVPVNYNDPGGDKRKTVANKITYGGSNVPIEDRPGVWAIGGEFSLSVLGIYFTLSPQIVIDAKGKAVIYIGYSDGINKGVDIKPYETLNQKGLPFSFGGGVTYTVINAPSIEEYVDADQMLDIGGGVGKGSFSVLRFKKEEDYYYGGTVGIGKYSPNVHAGLVENEGIVIHLN